MLDDLSDAAFNTLKYNSEYWGDHWWKGFEYSYDHPELDYNQLPYLAFYLGWKAGIQVRKQHRIVRLTNLLRK